MTESDGCGNYSDRLAFPPIIDHFGPDHEVLVTLERPKAPSRPVSIHRPLCPDAPVPVCGLGGNAEAETFDRHEMADVLSQLRENDVPVRPCGSCYGNHRGACGKTPHFPTVAEYRSEASDATGDATAEVSD